MIGFGEMVNGAAGAWKILRGDPQGMRHFDVSAEGFWRSFAVIVPLLVPSLIIIAAEHRFALYREGTDPGEFPTVLFVVVQILARLVAWFGTPLIYAAIAGPIGIAPRFSPLIVAGNWSSLLGVLPYTVAALLYAAGLTSPGVYGVMNLVAFGFDLTLAFRVARAATGAPVNVSIGLVLVGLLFAVLVGNVASRIIGY